MTAIVLLSGGLESAVAAMMASDDDSDIHAIVFSYNHADTDLAYKVASKIKARSITDISLDWYQSNSMPLRNGVMLTIGAAYADMKQADSIYHWASESDEQAYHDCRPEMYFALQNAFMTGSSDAYPIVRTPLMDMSKADIRKKAEKYGLLDPDYGLYA